MLDLTDLSERELAVLELASEGLTDREISDRLNISVSTVSSYWVRIRGKLGHFTRTELAAQFLKTESNLRFDKLLASHTELETRAGEHDIALEDLRLAQFYKAVLAGMPDPLLVLDRGVCIEYANERACAFLGCAEHDAVGESLSKFYPNTLKRAQAEQMEKVLNAPGLKRLGHRGAFFIMRPNGLHARVTMHLNAVEAPAGQVTVCVMRSFTDEIEAMRERIEVVRNSLS